MKYTKIAVGTAIERIAFVGNHLPRRCGIATFTSDLSAAVATLAPAIDCQVVAMNDAGHGHIYPPNVRFEIEDGELAGYRRASQFLNAGQVDVVSLQHEYGIFGGPAGHHVVTLLRELRMPVVTTLHTIRTAPSAQQRSVLDEVIALSERLVVMSEHGRRTVTELHGVPGDRIDVIPHGIPLPTAGAGSADRLGFGDQRVLLTFGLLSPDKGLEYVIEAMPAILEKHPNSVFLVLGATHPHVKERHGEAYRLSLTTLARRLGVSDQVVFDDRFVNDAELADFLAVADIYVTPYLNPEQSTSGTLRASRRSGQGGDLDAVLARASCSRRARRARPPRRYGGLATTICELLGDPVRRETFGKRAAEMGQRMSWPVVAKSYLESFEKARSQERREREPIALGAIPPYDPPELNLDHLLTMTDDTGLLQHASFATPSLRRGVLPGRQRQSLCCSRRCSRAPAPRTPRRIAISRRGTSLSSPTPSTRAAAASATSCRLRGSGPRTSARKTVTGTRSGLSARSSAVSAIPASVASVAICFRPPCPRSSSSRARAPGLTGPRHRRISPSIRRRQRGADGAQGAARLR